MQQNQTIPEQVDIDVYNFLLQRQKKLQNQNQQQQKKKESQQSQYIPRRLITPNINLEKKPEYLQKKLCVLYTQGSYNPVHKGHINMIIQAKQYLEQNTDYLVLQAYMSPSPQRNLDKKFEKMEKKSGKKSKKDLDNNQNQQQDEIILTLEERCLLLEKTIDNMKLSELVKIDKWEAFSGKVSHLDVWSSMQYHIDELIQENNFNQKIEVIWISGSDKIGGSQLSVNNARTKLVFKDKTYHLPLCIKDRPDINEQKSEKEMAEFREMNIEQQKMEKVFVIPPEGNYSSSQFRKLVQEALK